LILLFLLAQAVATVTAPANPPVPPPPAASAAPREGVTRYGPDFFADSRPANGLEMVQRLPGFSLDTGSGVRGYEGAAGNVLVDGQRPATKTDGLDELIKRIPAGAIDHIDVIRGGAPGIDMQGKTVIANIVRKSGGGFHGLLAYANSSLTDGRQYWAARAEGSGRVGQRSWEAAVFAGNGQDGGFGSGPIRQVDGKGKLLELGRSHAQGEASNFVANGALEQPLWGGALRINGRLSTQAYDSDETDAFTAPDPHATTEHQDDNFVQSEVGGRYAHSLGDRTTLEAVLLRQDKHEVYADRFVAPGGSQIFHLDNTTGEGIARAVLKFQQGPALSWEAGAEAADNTLDGRTRLTSKGAEIPLPAANVRVEEKRGELFGKAVWQVFPTVTLEGGVREEGSRIASSGDVVSQKTLYYTKPRALLTWSPDADTQVRLRVERAVGQLDFGAFVASTSPTTSTVSAGNVNLVPEQSWVTEAAAERRFWGRGSVTLTLRHSRISDAVDRAPIFGSDGSAFDAPANIGAGSKDEASVSFTLPLDRLWLKGAQIQGVYTRRQSAVTDPTTGREREISGLHPIDWEWHFTQDLPAHRLNWGIDMYAPTRQRYYRFNQVDTRKYGSFLAPFIEWKPRPDIAWRIEIDNAAHRAFKRSVDQYAGSRLTTPLDSVLARSQTPSQVFYIRLRKMFGT
jgi:outer membrane receptor protein involved in Fe transport